MNVGDIDKLREWRESPFAFVRDFWGLVPEYDNSKFVRHMHLSRHQAQIFKAVEKGLREEAPMRISIAAGHGVGKTSALAMLTHWFLFTRRDAQIGCTSPSSAQIFDILWKEIEVWHRKLAKPLQQFFIWQSSYYRMAESPQTWFARARTGRKESPEAFAGLHGKHVGLFADEASSVPDEIFRVAEGSLTDKDTLTILISNPTRLEGFFYDTHHDDKANWQTLEFSSMDSPLVDMSFVDRIKAKFGEDSDEYRFMVLGKFPLGESLVDGWLPMFGEEDIKNQISDIGGFMKPAYMGVDPAGMGRNKSIWVVRDAFKAKVVASEGKSNTLGIAEKTVTLAQHYEIKPEDVKLDNFGIGANVSAEIALGVHERIHAVNVGGKPTEERFLNLRSQGYWLFREWIKKGGKLVRHEGWRQLLNIRYKRTLSNKIQVMGKEEMVRKGFDSPDVADAGMLTFLSANMGNENSYRAIAGQGELSNEEIARLTNLY